MAKFLVSLASVRPVEVETDCGLGMDETGKGTISTMKFQMIGNHFEVVCHQLPHVSKIMHFLKLYLRLYEPCNHSKNASSSCL